MVTYSFSCYAGLQKAPITVSWKMCPIPEIQFIGENITIFWNETFQVPIFEKIHITESYLITFLVNIIGTTERTYKNKNPYKNVRLFIMIFID